MRFFNISLLVAAAAGLWSCSDPFFWSDSDVPGTLRLDVDLTWNGEAFGLGQTGTDHNNNTLRLENLQLYFSRLELRDLDSNWHQVGDVRLLDFNTDHAFILEEVPWGNYNAIRFGIGLPRDLNTGIDPASYPNDHPLSVAGSAGMFWTWATGYIFAKYEGKFAPNGEGDLIEPFSYHTGADSAYRRVTLEIPDYTTLYCEPRSLTVLNLELDAARCLYGPQDSIDIIADPITHSAIGTTLGTRVAELMSQAWSLKP